MYIQSKQENTKTKIEFPVYKKEICEEIDSVNENPALWTELLPTNHFIASLIDKRVGQNSELMCNSCHAI